MNDLSKSQSGSGAASVPPHMSGIAGMLEDLSKGIASASDELNEVRAQLQEISANTWGAAMREQALGEAMPPSPKEPEPESWVDLVRQLIGRCQKDMTFIRHSVLQLQTLRSKLRELQS